MRESTPESLRAKASVLAVGSELLSGQVVNTNAAWISRELRRLGFDIVCHLTVDDIEADIVSGLSFVAQNAGLILVTGGLGPTSDDLTRDAVARWSDEELRYHEVSWEHITRRFARTGRDVPEANRQQCFYPASARVLTNREGTANGFTLTAQGREVWVLPGPPFEIEAVWKDHVAPALEGRVAPSDRKAQKSWRIIGRGESHLAETVAPLLSSYEDLEIAYRAHAPYVELKLRYLASTEDKYSSLFSQIDQALAPWLFERDDEDVLALLAKRLASFSSISIYDGATEGHLMGMLAPYFRSALPPGSDLTTVTSWEGLDTPRAFVMESLDISPDIEISLAVAGFDDGGRWAVGCRVEDENPRVREMTSLYRDRKLRQRNLKAVAALTAKAWYEDLSKSLH